jgi:hypothetical protein
MIVVDISDIIMWGAGFALFIAGFTYGAWVSLENDWEKTKRAGKLMLAGVVYLIVVGIIKNLEKFEVRW